MIALVIVLCFFNLPLGCEFRTSQEPPPSAPPSPHIAPHLVTHPASPPLSLLVPVFGENGAFLGKGIPLDTHRIFVTGLLAPPAGLYLATPELSPLPVTGYEEGIGYLILTVHNPLPLAAPPRVRVRIEPGEHLLRVQPRPLYEERETLEVLAVNERFLVLSCPRAGSGYLFTFQGEWVPGVWLPDPQGGCSLLRLLPEFSPLSSPRAEIGQKPRGGR